LVLDKAFERTGTSGSLISKKKKIQRTRTSGSSEIFKELEVMVL
jgi:hypothetical protein